MVSKKQLSNTKKLAINKAIDLMSAGKLSSAMRVILNNFSKNTDIYLFFKGWQAQLQNKHELAIKLFEQSLLKNPIREDTLIGLAASYLELGDFSRARECAEQALIVNPQSAQTMLTLATIISKQDSKNFDAQEQALQHLENALDIVLTTQADSNALLVDIISAMGACFLNQKLNYQAEVVLEKAVSLDRYNIVANKNLASVYANLRKIDKAIEACKIAEMSDDVSDKIDSMYQQGMLQLMNGNYAKGWRLHESRLHSVKYSQRDLLIANTLNFEALTEHDSVLLFQEQGIGDFLQFSRYIPIISAKCKNIDVVILPNSYLPINNEIPSIKRFVELNFGKYIRQVLVKSVDKISKDYTYSASLMSLPYILKTRKDSIPPVLPFITDALLLNKEGNRVGLFYKGSAHHSNNYNRSMPLEYVKKLVSANPDITFVNMQLDNELSEFPNVTHMDTSGLEILLAALNHCKLLVTVDSMIAHLAGGANIPTLVMHAYSSDWRWGVDTDKSDWYPSIKNIRQDSIGDWNTVLVKVQAELNSIK